MKDYWIFLWQQFGPQEVCSSFNDVNGKIPHRTTRPLVTSSNKRPHSSQSSNIRITPDAPGLACVWPSVGTPCRSALSFWLSHCTKLVSCIRPVMGDSFKSLPGSSQANKARLWSDKDKQKVDLWRAVTLFTVERLGRLNACCDVGSSVAMVTLLQRSIAENSIERCVWNIMSDDSRDHLKTTLRFYEVKMDGLRRLKEVWWKPSRLDWFIIENNLFPHCKTVLFLIYWLVCYTHIWNKFNLLFEIYNHSICTMHYVTVLSWSIGSFKYTLWG